jgi:2-polyprenyl-6-methoxyphenol hydroxylase-like FAD-dependent oxidoreductase
MRVIVVGAGLGGLCVANGLVKAGIEVEVLEADADIGDHRQGYRININATGHQALAACLPAEVFAAYEDTLHRQRDPGVHLYSPALDLIARHQAPWAPGAADRGTLRRVLAEGVADRIRFGHRVESLRDVGPADLVIAADGVGSALRQELLPGVEPRSLGMAAIFGRSPLTAAARPWTPPVIRDSRFCGIVDGDTVLALCGYDPPTAADPYVMWVLMGPLEHFPEDGTTPADLVAFARNRTTTWDARATAPLRTTTVADTFRTTLRAMPSIPPIPRRAGTPVAFLGDAVHAMSPAGGEGANTAFNDAALLNTHLRAPGPILDAVLRYHDDLRGTAGEALRRSAGYAVAREANRA